MQDEIYKIDLVHNGRGSSGGGLLFKIAHAYKKENFYKNNKKLFEFPRMPSAKLPNMPPG